MTWITGKGRREKELIPLPAVVVAAIRRYLVHRGTAAGPLFQTRGHRGKQRSGGLETRSVLKIVRTLGQRVGLHVWCHGLRHTSITQAAELGQRAGLGLDKIRAHSRHRTIATLMLYVDEHDRQTTQATLADLVAGTVAEKDPCHGTDESGRLLTAVNAPPTRTKPPTPDLRLHLDGE